jgi:hypothetical protein
MAVICAFVVPSRIGDVRVGIDGFHLLGGVKRIFGFDLHMAITVGN